MKRGSCGFLRLGVVLIGTALACAPSGMWAQGVAAHIPVAHGKALSGTEVTFPDALKGKVGVVVVGFSHASQAQVSGWGKRLAAEYAQSANLAYYELPMLAGAPGMIRGMIVKSMQSHVPEAEKPHFVPLMQDEDAWRKAAHFSRDDDAYVLVTNGDGAVRWQTEGEATDAAWGELKKQVEDATAAGVGH